MEQDYFEMFMVEVIKDLKKKGFSYVFSQEQVNYIKSIKKYKKINVYQDNDIYYLSIKKMSVDKLKRMC